MEFLLNLDNTKNSDGMNEVHTSICPICPTSFYMSLGTWENGEQAILHAKRRGYSKIKKCQSCC